MERLRILLNQMVSEKTADVFLNEIRNRPPVLLVKLVQERESLNSLLNQIGISPGLDRVGVITALEIWSKEYVKKEQGPLAIEKEEKQRSMDIIEKEEEQGPLAIEKEEEQGSMAIIEKEEEKSLGTDEIDKSLTKDEENVENWSLDQVFAWAKNIVGEKYAEMLRTEEVNGKALLKQTKADLKGYGFVGGPATNLFEAIQELKTSETQDKDFAINTIRRRKYNPPNLPTAKPHFYERQECIDKVSEYISNVKQISPGAIMDKKFSLLGTSGMKGIGKTELLKQLCDRPRELNVDQTFYITFNGGENIASEFKKNVKSNSCGTVFAHLLLKTCGVDLKLAQFLELDEAMKEFRNILKISDEQTLLICVDEVGELGNDLGQQLLSDLMQYMDAKKGKLIFVFTHIMESFLLQSSTGSGRTVMLIPLYPLSIDIWRNINYLKTATSHNPPLHQLLLSCSGHPRSIFDGIPQACKENPTLLTQSNEQAIIVARQTIINKCKFQDISDAFLYTHLKKWFAKTITEEEKEKLKDMGLLIQIKSSDKNKNTELFFPLLMQNWASRKSSNNQLAYHLQQAYAADAVLGPDNEKKMEAIMYHYEAVLRICTNQSFSIGSFYQASFCGVHTEHLEVPLPYSNDGGGECLVKFVSDFSETEDIISDLKCGLILVSQKQSEEGIEYLVPFLKKKDQSLVIGAVQCKFVKETNWKTIKTKVDNAIQGFTKKGIMCFPVVFSTVDQSFLKPNTYKGGIYFTQQGIFEFTSRLGILRLHTQKLGKALKKQYPILERARSGLDIPLDWLTTNTTTSNLSSTSATSKKKGWVLEEEEDLPHPSKKLKVKNNTILANPTDSVMNILEDLDITFQPSEDFPGFEEVPKDEDEDYNKKESKTRKDPKDEDDNIKESKTRKDPKDEDDNLKVSKKRKVPKDKDENIKESKKRNDPKDDNIKESKKRKRAKSFPTGKKKKSKK